MQKSAIVGGAASAMRNRRKNKKRESHKNMQNQNDTSG